MSVPKWQMHSREMGEDSDSRNSTYVPKMELLKTNYIHQGKNAIMYRSSEPHFAARRSKKTRFVENRRPLRNLSQAKHSHKTSRSLWSNTVRTEPKVHSLELVLNKSEEKEYIPTLKAQDAFSQSSCFCHNLSIAATEFDANLNDGNQPHSLKGQCDYSYFLTEAGGIQSRADRIARIETSTHLKPEAQILKPVTELNETGFDQRAPDWIFKNTRIGDVSSSSKLSAYNSESPPEENKGCILQQATMLDRAYIKNRRPLITTEGKMAMKEAELRQTNYSDIKYDYKTCSTSQDLHMKKAILNKVPCSKQCKPFHNVDYDYYENIQKLQLSKENERQMRDNGDPNDLQNFLKKNLIKATTNELLKAAAQSTKKCNIDLERKLNDLNMREEDHKSNDSGNCYNNDPYLVSMSKMNSFKFIRSYNKDCDTIFPTGNRSELKEFRKFIRPQSSDFSSSASVSLCSCDGSCLNKDSVCDSEEDCCECNEYQCIPTPNNDLSKDVLNAVEGVFWNTAYDDFQENITSSFCCASLCNDDGCSYFDESLSVDIKSNNAQSLHESGVDEKLSRKTINLVKAEDIKDLTQGSSDGSDTHLSKFSEIFKNPQDTEMHRHRRGHVLRELFETEKIYVNEIASILKGYYDRLKSDERAPASLQGNANVIFGNLHELYSFHKDVFLKDLENCISVTERVALCFAKRRDTFYHLYSFYCQNIQRSEKLRETLVDTHMFFQECQIRLGHKLPLAAYLLKPVQRITKYQLLLKDLLLFTDNDSCRNELKNALDCMLIVLKCVNDSMHQISITGFPSDLAQQGDLLMQDSFQVWIESKKDIRLRMKPKRRHIFLYQKSLLLCKQISKPGHDKSSYQFKSDVKMSQVGLTESVHGDEKRFEVWLKGRQEVYTLQAPTIGVKDMWVAEIKRVLFNQLEKLKGDQIAKYNVRHQSLWQKTSCKTPNITLCPSRKSLEHPVNDSNRNTKSRSDKTCSSDKNIVNELSVKDQHENSSWSSDCSDIDNDERTNPILMQKTGPHKLLWNRSSIHHVFIKSEYILNRKAVKN
ncbi:uncharacterized protein LOC6541768 isoform X1 [Drosophila erecta]|uniref:DH domain-containing protein n=1 Tax=Drosophila erecta TaxID=7220 RepID=B3N3L2_DROER|nr:uncharacterized protein LOC6541768 isoform X1 [Drosophila erecta]EDV59894.1 uncharacterized protein Dere_GG10861 [Drosophila erecta]